MGERARVLAAEFQVANEELITLVRSLSEEEWRTRCIGEERTVGLVAYHVAEGHALAAAVIRAVAGRGPLPSGLVRNKAEADLKNARQADEHASCTLDETAELLRSHGDEAASLVLSLTDENPESTRFVWGREASVDQLIEHVLIGHLRGHLVTIRATIEQAGS